MQITIIRGLPGSGKSTYAHKLALQWGAVVVEQDQFRVRNFKYVFKNEDDIQPSFLAVLQEYAKWGADIIITGTFVSNRSIERVLGAIRKVRPTFGLKVRTMLTQFKSVHDVPDTVLASMMKNWEDVEGESFIKPAINK